MKTYERSWWWVKDKVQMALVFVTVTMILQFQIKGCVGCLETERMGLLQLKSYLTSQASDEIISRYIFESWSDDDPESECCHWERIKCSDATGGHIVHLSLDNLNFEQAREFNLSLLHSFPQLKTLDVAVNYFDHLFDPIHGHKSLQRLENLETLNMSANQFNNNVLPFLYTARSLRNLNLCANRLKGVIPPNGLINFRDLEELDLSYNSINDVEAGDGLRTMKLKTLDLSGNKLSDTSRLKVLKNMPKLQELSLSGNGFTKLDSLGLENLVELEVLSLAENVFNNTRSIQVIKDMTMLRELDLSGNELADLDSLGLVFPPYLRVLNLKDNQLFSTNKGYSKLCGLMNLRELDLSNNTLISMPNCLGNLSHLRTLELSENHLAEDLSSFVAGLPSALEYLSLLDNNFNGSFLFNSLVNLTNLTVFRLSSKVGMIQAQDDSSWVPLFQLKRLILQNFILGSTVPGFLVHQHDLRFVGLSHNELTGAFPAWLVQNNTKLLTILLNSNSLTKLQLPSFVHGLEVLDISSNKIKGSIQEDLGIVFPKLMYMKFSSNQFHGNIPSSIGEMKSLDTLDVSSNALSGQLPKPFLSGCYSMLSLVLSHNQYRGEIFQEHANLTGLGWLSLAGNYFNGSLGKGLSYSKNIGSLDISDNCFSGTFPLWISKMPSLWYLYMRGNQLKGPFPHQLQSLRLEVMDISSNSFSGLIPRNVNFSYLTELRLQNNRFVGSIPEGFFKSEILQVLDLRSNNFSGKIPNGIGKRLDLAVLLLRDNNLQGHIPEEICQLSQISILDLSHNKFKGSIPTCLGNMSFGARGDEAYQGNTLSTSGLPTVVAKSDYSSVLDLDFDFDYYSEIRRITRVNFLTKNRYETYQGGILGYMSGLDLSSNELSGEIPVEIQNLQDIISLNLSGNHLTGSIPKSISKLKDLESLDLSNNNLDGNIPSELADLNNLGYFNVSCNNLSGEIPFKGHLLTFDETSFIGNARLCGLPTRISCSPMIVSNPGASFQAKEEDEGVIDMVWFYWTCGAVYISTSLALFAFLCVDTRLSQELFYRVDLLIHYLQRYKCSSFCN